MKNHCYYLLLILFGFLFIGKIQAQENTESYKTIGVFIAINEYSGNIWQALNNPVVDANAIKDVLTEKYYFDELISVYDADATRKNIIDTLDVIVSKLNKNDRLLIYFSGHGIEIGEEGYWVPYDASNEDRSQLIPNSEIKNTLAKSDCKHALLMVDACFSGSIFKSTNMYYRNDGAADYYDKISNVTSRQAITAGGLEPVLDGSGANSVFAKYILKFLNNNEQAHLAASELYELIKYPIAANSPNSPMFGHIQDTGHEGGQFVFELISANEAEVVAAAEVVFEEEKVVVKDCSHLKVEIEEGKKIRFEGNKDNRLHALSSDPDVSYQWYEGLTALKYNSPIFEVNKSSEYTIIITDKFNCSSAATVEVEVIYNNAFVNIIEGAVVKFTHEGVLNTKTNVDGLEIEWRFNNFIVGNEESLKVTESGIYTVNIKDAKEQTIATATTEVTIEARSYTVNVGDNIERLARKFYNDEAKKQLILDANPSVAKNNGSLKVGETILIPSDINNQTTTTQQLIIGGVNDFIPFSAPGIYKNGMVTDIAIQVFMQMKVTTSMDFSSKNKVKSGVYNGVYGVALPLAKTPFDELSLYFSEPLYKVLNVFFVKKDAEIEFKKNKDLKGKKIAIAKGVNINELNELAGKGIVEVIPALTLEIAFQMLEKGEVDMVASPQLVGLLALQSMTNLGVEDFDILGKEIGTEELFMVVSKNHPNAENLIKDFNAAFLVMKKNGKIEKIINSHLDKYQKP
jgi:ABC-type amino acid transport substrate-binding protein/phage tail protein X